MFCCLSNCVYFVAETDAMWDICSVSLHTTSVLLLTTHWGSIMRPLLITVYLPGSNAGARVVLVKKHWLLFAFQQKWTGCVWNLWELVLWIHTGTCIWTPFTEMMNASGSKHKAAPVLECCCSKPVCGFLRGYNATCSTGATGFTGEQSSS